VSVRYRTANPSERPVFAGTKASPRSR